ncbi:MAG: SRPBCC domain-containing protein [Kineosporiaceae bacterium]
MQPDSYTATFVVDRTPEEVLDAVLDVPSWWTGEVSGPTREVGDEFEYRYPDMHVSRQRVLEAGPRRVRWLVTTATLTFVEASGEWAGTEIVFDLEPEAGGTRVTFTHDGLVPALQCWDACSQGWESLALSALRAGLAGARA